MVLFVDGLQISHCPKSIHSFFSRHPFLINQSKQFKSLPVQIIQSSGCLYVSQSEYAVIPNTDNRVKYLGSEDATTCHIILFLHSNGAALAHFDGLSNDETAIYNMISRLVNNSNDLTVEVHAIGGFYGNKRIKGVQESENLSLKLLTALSALHFTFNIVLWSTCELNTANISEITAKPYHYGMCYDRLSSSVFPAKFESHGPQSSLKTASNMLIHDCNMKNLYDYKNHSIKIPLFHNEDPDYFLNLSKWSDDELLYSFSTSPSAEPPSFIENARKAFHLLSNNPFPYLTLFPNGRSLIFVLQENGDWEVEV